MSFVKNWDQLVIDHHKQSETKIIKNNHKIYGIGAPSRASTLINYLGLTNEMVRYVCEVEGSYKIGNYMPGTNIEIISEKKLYLDKPEYALLLSWHISKELISNLNLLLSLTATN